MSEWDLAQSQPADQLAKLHFFSINTQQAEREVEFCITIREYATLPAAGMKFFAEADKQTNQSTAPYTPIGWGDTLLDALSECIRAIHRFPYEAHL